MGINSRFEKLGVANEFRGFAAGTFFPLSPPEFTQAPGCTGYRKQERLTGVASLSVGFLDEEIIFSLLGCTEAGSRKSMSNFRIETKALLKRFLIG